LCIVFVALKLKPLIDFIDISILEFRIFQYEKRRRMVLRHQNQTKCLLAVTLRLLETVMTVFVYTFYGANVGSEICQIKLEIIYWDTQLTQHDTSSYMHTNTACIHIMSESSWLNLHLPMQSMHITTNFVSSNPIHS
jgi:hypothetical protein